MRQETKDDYQVRIERAVEFVLDRIDTPPSPADIASYSGYSAFHFSRLFALAVGESVSEFVRRIRLERSAWQLENTPYSVTEIAFQAGYGSLEGYSRAFRQEFLISPSEFRAEPTRCEISCVSEVHWSPDGSRSHPLLSIDGESEMELRIENLEAMKVLALRHVGPYHTIGQKFGELCQYLAMNGIPFNMMLAVYHDDPDTVPAGELTSDACMRVPDDFEIPSAKDGLTLMDIAGGRYVVGTHMGPYSGLGDAWARFSREIPSMNVTLDSCSPFEIYVNDCTKVPESEVRTDLYFKLVD